MCPPPTHTHTHTHTQSHLQSGYVLPRKCTVVPHPIHTTGLAERIDIEHPLLNNEIETTEFVFLAAHFDNVIMYSLALGLTPAQQADVKHTKMLYDTQTAMMECLSMWQRRNPADATYRTLLKLLLRMEKYSVANEIYKHCLENSKLT